MNFGHAADRRRDPIYFRELDKSDQYLELQNGTDNIVLPFRAGEVNVVIRPGASGKAGADVGLDRVARFDRSGMIRLVARAPRGNQVLTVDASDPGLQVYVFTFGP